MIDDLEEYFNRPLPTKEDYLRFIDKIPSFPHIAIDTESDPDTHLFLGTSCAYLEDGIYFPVGHLEEGNIDDEVLDKLLVEYKNHPLRVFQNAGHDLQKIKDDLNCPLDGPFADTLIMVHMINEELPSKGLDYIHKHYTGGQGKVRHPFMQRVIDSAGWRYVPLPLMIEYATYDAIDTSQVFEVVRPLFEKEYGRMFL